MTRTILVTGATGRLGSLVVDRLLTMEDVRVRVMLRQARMDEGAFAASDVEAVHGDLDQPETLNSALEGVAGIFQVSPVHPDMVQRETNLIAAAAETVPDAKIVKISGLATREDSFVDSGRWHAEIEAGFRAHGLNATCLRPNFFMQNLAFQAGAVRESGEIRSAVADARIAMVDTRDIADVAVSVLMHETPIDGQSVGLTTGRSCDYDELATVFAAAFERSVSYRRQSDDDLRVVLEKGGQPDWHIRIILAFNEAFRRGWGAEVTDHVEAVLGRPARSLESFVAELAAGAKPGGADPFPS